MSDKKNNEEIKAPEYTFDLIDEYSSLMLNGITNDVDPFLLARLRGAKVSVSFKEEELAKINRIKASVDKDNYDS